MKTLFKISYIIIIFFCTTEVYIYAQLPPYMVKNVFNTPINELVTDSIDNNENLSTNSEDLALRENIIKTAKKYIGAKYRHGHSGPRVFDCSGYTSFVFRQYNITLSRSSRYQYKQGSPIDKIPDLKIGDLVFFGSRRNPKRIGHVGIVTEVDTTSGKFKFIHASVNGVRISPSDEKYYRNRYIGARRIIKN